MRGKKKTNKGTHSGLRVVESNSEENLPQCRKQRKVPPNLNTGKKQRLDSGRSLEEEKRNFGKGRSIFYAGKRGRNPASDIKTTSEADKGKGVLAGSR